MGTVRLIPGDCIAALRKLPDNSVDSVVTDPPYGIGFMGQKWDAPDNIAFRKDVWLECLRVLKPGGHLAAFSATRTYHRMAVAIEDSGFEIRDQLGWLYGTGFPKAQDVGMQIDKLDATSVRRDRSLKFTAWMRSTGLTSREVDDITGTVMGNHYTTGLSQPRVATREHFESLRPHLGIPVPAWVELLVDERTVESHNFARREVVGTGCSSIAESFGDGEWNSGGNRKSKVYKLTVAATPEAAKWDGWKTALKPAWEIICLAQKPFEDAELYGIIGSKLFWLWGMIWSSLPASAAERYSALSPLVQGEETSDFAHKNAERLSCLRDALSGLMGTSQSELAIIMSLNTVSSWVFTWAALSKHGNTSTIETKLSTITTLGTLNSLLSQITPESIIMAHKNGRWSIANASDAEKVFSATVARLDAILELSAAENATCRVARHYQDAGERPGLNPICLARKPLVGTVAANVLAHGTGALNIDATRIASGDENPSIVRRQGAVNHLSDRPARETEAEGRIASRQTPEAYRAIRAGESLGRYPANLIHDGSDEVVALFPTTGKSSGVAGAARYFYTAKASKDDRCGSRHPTVKPIALMRWLVRLTCPPGGTVLDPFAGTGTTGEAALLEGFSVVMVEREAEYRRDIERRIDRHMKRRA